MAHMTGSRTYELHSHIVRVMYGGYIGLHCTYIYIWLYIDYWGGCGRENGSHGTINLV